MQKVTITTIAARPWPDGRFTLVINGEFVLTTASAIDHHHLADQAMRLKNRGFIHVGPTTNWAPMPIAPPREKASAPLTDSVTGETWYDN